MAVKKRGVKIIGRNCRSPLFFCILAFVSLWSPACTGRATIEILRTEISVNSVIVANGSEVRLGSTVVGQTLVRSIVVKNLSEADLPLSVTNSNAGLCSLSGGNTRVARGDSVALTLSCAPASAGTASGILEFSFADKLAAVFVKYQLDVTPSPVPEIRVRVGGSELPTNSSYNVGNILESANSVVTFTIDNLGMLPLQLTAVPAVAVSGTHAANFPAGNPSLTVPAGGSTTFDITFSPGSPGVKAAAITIANNDPDESGYVINLTGTGVAIVPEIQVTMGATNYNHGSTYTFASTTQGSTASAIFEIRNQGTANLVLSGTPRVAITGADAGYFSVLTQPGGIILPGANSTFSVQFNPITTGGKTATLVIANNDADESSYTITLSGSVNAPNIVVERNSVVLQSGISACDLGLTVAGAGSTSDTITIRNTGNQALSLGSASFTGPDAAEFGIFAYTTSLAAGTSISATFYVNASTMGNKTATLVIPSGDYDTPSFYITVTAMAGLWTRKRSNSVEWLKRQTFSVANTGTEIYVIAGYDPNYNAINHIHKSTNGTVWQPVSQTSALPVASGGVGVWFAGKLFHYGGNGTSSLVNLGAYRSTDMGVTWTKYDTSSWLHQTSMASVIHNGNLFLLGGRIVASNSVHGQIRSSADGENWTLLSSTGWPGASDSGAVSFGGKIWLIGGFDAGGGTTANIHSSTDGITWTHVTGSAPFGQYFGNQLAVHAGKIWLVSSGNTSEVWSSADGSAWTKQVAAPPWGKRYSGTLVSMGGKLYLIAGVGPQGTTDEVYSSSDGINWTNENARGQIWRGRWSHQVVKLGSKLLLMGGTDGQGHRKDVWESTNGVDWTKNPDAPWSERIGLRSIVVGSEAFVIGGGTSSGSNLLKNDVWKTTDGNTWTQVTANAGWGRRYYHGLQHFGGKFHVFSGTNESNGRYCDAWSSSDALTWSQAATSAPCAEGAAVLQFLGKIWSYSGWNGFYINSNQSTTDGMTWTSNTAVSWTARVGASAFSYKGYALVMLGSNSSYLTSTMYSSDGVNWAYLGVPAALAGRDYQQMLLFNDGSGDKMWMFGGAYYNDIWTFELP